MKKCFIVCPIGDEGSETRKRSDKMLRHVITPVCKECGFEPTRIDQENKNGSITDGILKHLNEDDLVIADLTENNPNAFYEIGYRAALKKPAVHLMAKDSSIPFDVSAIRSFSYDLADLDSVEELKERLIQTIKSIDFDSQESSKNSPANNTDNHSSNNNFNMIAMLILQEIYKLQDNVKKMSETLENKDSAAVSVLADKLTNATPKSPETVVLETFISKMFDNPEQLLKLATISKNFPTD